MNDQRSSLTVASFNVRYGPARDGIHSWPDRRQFAVATARGLDADILGLQEPVDYQVEFFAEHLPDYDWVGLGRDDGERGGEYCPIYVRRDRGQIVNHGTFWLSDTPEVAGSRTWGNRCVRICTYAEISLPEDSGSVFVFNCHLDHESQFAREAAVRLIRNRMELIAAGRPTILMGDFNVTPENPALTPLHEDYRDVHAHLPSTEGTFHGFSDAAPFDKIDYIWVNHAWEIDHAEIHRDRPEGMYPSDHDPVSARLRLSQTA